jgi:hypothetical protein
LEKFLFPQISFWENPPLPLIRLQKNIRNIIVFLFVATTQPITSPFPAVSIRLSSSHLTSSSLTPPPRLDQSLLDPTLQNPVVVGSTAAFPPKAGATFPSGSAPSAKLRKVGFKFDAVGGGDREEEDESDSLHLPDYGSLLREGRGRKRRPEISKNEDKENYSEEEEEEEGKFVRKDLEDENEAAEKKLNMKKVKTNRVYVN